MADNVIHARVASEIELRIDELDPAFLVQIKAALQFENEDKKKQLALNIWGAWDLPDVITMWRVENNRRSGEHVICLPRGFAAQLVVGASTSGYTIEWQDLRSSCSSQQGYFRPFVLRDYQLKAVLDMLVAEQGIYRAPAGSGKTTTALGLMTYAQQRTIVITDKAFLLEQWRERAAQFLGLSLDYDDEQSVGKIGEDVWEERDLTICLRQTLWSRLWELKSTGWFKRIGLVVVDESHHLAADTVQSIVREIPSRMFFGVSATPARTKMQGEIIGSLLGPIVAETTRQELYDRGILMRPTLRVVQTDLDTTFWKDHDSDQNGDCQKPDCYKKIPHSHKNNWSSVLRDLVEDEDRNRLIAQKIISERGLVHLVPSRQLKHLNLIRRALKDEGWEGPIYLLRGEENARGDAQHIVKAIEAGGHWEAPPEVRKLNKKKIEKMRAEAEEAGGEFDDPNARPWVQIKPPVKGAPREAVILSTVADEGMDVPIISRVHMVFPLRQEAATIQLVGRGERVAPGKKDYVIVDFHDHQASVFTDQFAERLRTYRYQGVQDEVVELDKV